MVFDLEDGEPVQRIVIMGGNENHENPVNFQYRNISNIPGTQG